MPKKAQQMNVMNLKRIDRNLFSCLARGSNTVPLPRGTSPLHHQGTGYLYLLSLVEILLQIILRSKNMSLHQV